MLNNSFFLFAVTGTECEITKLPGLISVMFAPFIVVMGIATIVQIAYANKLMKQRIKLVRNKLPILAVLICVQLLAMFVSSDFIFLHFLLSLPVASASLSYGARNYFKSEKISGKTKIFEVVTFMQVCYVGLVLVMVALSVSKDCIFGLVT